MELGIGLLLGGKVTWLLLKVHPNGYLESQIDAITTFMIFDNRIWFLIIPVLVLWVVFLIFEIKGLEGKGVFRACRNVVYCFAIVAGIVVVCILWIGAHGELPKTIMDSVNKIPYLVWGDNWGNNRGFTWRVTWRMISEFSFVKLLFGVGPDGFA